MAHGRRNFFCGRLLRILAGFVAQHRRCGWRCNDYDHPSGVLLNAVAASLTAPTGGYTSSSAGNPYCDFFKYVAPHINGVSAFVYWAEVDSTDASIEALNQIQGYRASFADSSLSGCDYP